MSTASDNTNEQPLKRARFSENNDKTTTSSHKVQPPKLLAESFIRASIATLHPIIATNVEKLAKEQLLLLSKKHHLQKANQRMVNDKELIPKSARIKFELSVSDRVKDMPEYKALLDQTNNVVSETHKSFKELIVSASKLEITAITNEIKTHLVKSIRLITNACLLYNNNDSNVDGQVHILAQHYLDNISVHTPMTLATFIKLYKEVHTIETFPPTTTATSTSTTTTSTRTATSTRNTTATTSPFFGNSGNSGNSGNTRQQTTTTSSTTSTPTASQMETEPTTTIIPKIYTDIKDIFEASFVSPWTEYLKQQFQNELSVELKKLSTTYFTTRSTSETVAAVDAEPSADKKELKALISLETQSATKEFLKKLNDMQKKLTALESAKNSNQRGKGSASAKKTNTPTTTTKKDSKKLPKKKKSTPTKSFSKSKSGSFKKRKAAGNNNGNGSEKKNSKKNTGNKKSNGNGTKSNNNKRRQNIKSNNK